MSCANSTPPVSIQKACSTPCESSIGKRRGSSSSDSSVMGRPIAARLAAERSGPIGTVAGKGERTGRGEKTLPEIAPQFVPCLEGIVDHACIACVIAVGMANQAMLVHRRGQWIGQRSLLE